MTTYDAPQAVEQRTADSVLTLRAPEAGGDGVAVEISGTGSGIAPAIRVRIFDP